jgi:hypothetical protein
LKPVPPGFIRMRELRSGRDHSPRDIPSPHPTSNATQPDISEDGSAASEGRVAQGDMMEGVQSGGSAMDVAGGHGLHTQESRMESSGGDTPSSLSPQGQ